MSETQSGGGLVRALGVWGLAASVINITIGGGIYRAPGATEVSGRLGSAAPIAYIVCAVAMALVVLCIAEAGSRIATSGGPYAYVERAFGPVAAFAVGWLNWVTGTIATAAVATIFADSTQHMIPALANPGGRAALIVAMFAIVTAVNVRGVQFGARLNIASTIVKLTPLAVLIVLGLVNLKAENVAIHSIPPASDITRASIFLLFIFAGIESAITPSGEVKDPGRTVPRAVFLALAVVSVVYLLVQLAAQGVLGPRLAGNPSPLGDLAAEVLGPAGGVMLGLTVIFSTFGYLSGMTLAVPRTLFAFAQDGILPKAVSSVHPRFRTPWIAIMVQVALSMTLALSSGFEPLVILANVSVLAVYMGCAAAAWHLQRKNIRDADAPMAGAGRIPGSAIAAPLSAVVVIVLLSSVTAKEWLVCGGAAAVGFVLYAASPAGWLRRAKS